jgi:hypothetical protein
MVDPDTKAVPETVMGKLLAPALANAGEMLEMLDIASAASAIVSYTT